MPECTYCGRYSDYGVCPFDGTLLEDFYATRCPNGHDLSVPVTYRQYTYHNTLVACPYCRTPYLYGDLSPDLKARFDRERAARGCLIATAAYGTPMAKQILVLKRWRDEKLIRSTGGRIFVSFYYITSPTIARIIWRSDKLKSLIRSFISPIVRHFEYRYEKVVFHQQQKNTC